MPPSFVRNAVKSLLIELHNDGRSANFIFVVLSHFDCRTVAGLLLLVIDGDHCWVFV